MEPRDAAADAAERAEAAGRRTRDIADRLTRLAQGQPASTSDLRLAQEYAEDARQRAQDSALRSVAGHERAARSHERAAEVHEEAARRGIGNTAEHTERARAHRQEALTDLREAASQRDRVAPAAPPQDPSPDMAQPAP